MISKRPLVGVIGGMGTQATACFYEELHSMQRVDREQEYLDVLLYSMPSIPDRTAFITGKSPVSPLEPLLSAASTLESAGASLLVMLCITSHYFFDDLKGAVGIPFLSMPEETALYSRERGFGKVGLLATNGTLKGRVLQNAFERVGIDVVAPLDCFQADLMAMIYDIKRGVSVAPVMLEAMVDALRGDGADAVVLGCTELCVIAGGELGVINTLDVLAGAVLRVCGV